MKWSGLAFAAIAVAACSPKTPDPMAAYVKTQWQGTRERLLVGVKDPGSVKFGSVWEHNGAICGFVNAKNSYGAYTGPRRFVGSPDRVFIDDPGHGIDQDLWDRGCGAANTVIMTGDPPPPAMGERAGAEEASQRADDFKRKYHVQ